MRTTHFSRFRRRIGRNRPAMHKEPALVPNFTQWLAHFGTTPRYALLMRFAHEDRGCWPERATTLRTFLRHLRDSHKGERDKPAEEDLRRAFNAFRKFIAAGGTVPRRYGPPKKPPEEKRQLKTYLVLPATVERILELKRTINLPSQGGVVDLAIAELYARKSRH